MDDVKKKVLIVEDEADAAFILSRRLITAGYTVDTATDSITAMSKLKTFAPSVIILDMMFPGGGGVNLLKNIRLSTKTAGTHVIVTTGVRDESQKKITEELGVKHYFLKPYPYESLIQAIEKSEVVFVKNNPGNPVAAPQVTAFKGSGPSRPKKILLVEDQDDLMDVLSMRVRKAGYETLLARDGEEALTKTFTFKPDLIILDINLPKINGWYVAMKLKREADFKSIPIILLSGLITEDGEAQKGIDQCDYMMKKPYNHEVLLRKVQELLSKS